MPTAVVCAQLAFAAKPQASAVGSDEAASPSVSRAAATPSFDPVAHFDEEERDQRRAEHAEALAAGARDNGAPGLRAHYHPNYYGAFAIDPDGHNIEAVCHLPADTDA